MRRDQLDLSVRGVAWVDDGAEPERPRVHIDADEAAASALRERLRGPDGEPLAAAETDVAVRLLGDPDDPETVGVVSVTDRVTGEFVLELNEAAEDVLRFIRAARRYGEHAGGDGEYVVAITAEGEPLVELEKTTFLVYTEDGELLRKHSLIPSGVEL